MPDCIQHPQPCPRLPRGPKVPNVLSNYELFNRNNFNIRLLELELPRLLAPDLPSNCSSLRYLNCTHCDRKIREDPTPLFLVTISMNYDWIIYAPAAFLGSGGRFSGRLSGIEP